VESQPRRATDLRRTLIVYRAWIWSGIAACLIGFLFAAVLTNFVWNNKELSELGGLLAPANDPTPPTPCDLEDGELGLLFGDSVSAKSKLFPLTVIAVNGKPAVVIDRNPDDTINLSLELRSRDDKVILRLNKNQFVVAPGNYLSRTRPDKSTLVVEDPYGKRVIIRYMNKHIFSLSGGLTFGNRTIDLNKDIRISQMCFDVVSRSGVINIQ
jgi:hypothetical protein